MFQEELLDGVVKGMFQGLVQRKDFQGSPCCDSQRGAVVMDIEKKSGDIVRFYGGLAGFAQRPAPVFREKEDKTEADRRPFAADHGLTPGFDARPSYL